MFVVVVAVVLLMLDFVRLFLPFRNSDRPAAVVPQGTQQVDEWMPLLDAVFLRPTTFPREGEGVLSGV